MRKFEITCSSEALVSTGPFENQRVFFAFKEVLEGDYSDEQIVEIQKEKYKKFCFEPIQFQESELAIKAVEKEFKHLRLLLCPKCGKKHPSVTTVRDFDSKGFFVSDSELELARAQGCITDIRCRHFVTTGEWRLAKDIPSCAPHLLTLKASGLDPNQFNYPAFLKKYPIRDMKNGERFFDCALEVTGEPDLIGTPDSWDFAESVPSMIDYKRNVDKLSAFTQMAAYAKQYGLKQMIAIPVNGDTAQGFSKPVVCNQVDEYYEVFQDKRRRFRQRYGI